MENKEPEIIEEFVPLSNTAIPIISWEEFEADSFKNAPLGRYYVVAGAGVGVQGILPFSVRKNVLSASQSFTSLNDPPEYKVQSYGFFSTEEDAVAFAKLKRDMNG